MSAPLSRFTSGGSLPRLGGGSDFFIRPHYASPMHPHPIVAHALFAPEMIPPVLVMFGSPLIALVLLGVSIVMFTEGKRGLGVYCLLIGLMFFIPLWGLQSDSRDMLIDFGIVSLVAAVSGFGYFIFYVRRKM